MTHNVFPIVLLAVVACSAKGDGDTGSDDFVDCSGTRWISAWAAPPTDVTTEVIGDQSVRLLLTPLRSGESARIRLSNRYGTQPLPLSSVYLGKQDDGAALRAGSQMPVLFDGQVEITIQPGEEVISDAVEQAIVAFEPVAISAFVPAPGAELTRHSLAMQTSFLAPPESGDVAALEDADEYTVTMSDRALVFGLEVRGPASGAVIAMVGDSLTDGVQSDGVDLNTRYPDALAGRLIEAGSDLSPINLGISGNRVLGPAVFPDMGAALLDRIGTDVLVHDDVTDVVLFEGINDLGVPPGTSADDLIDGLADAVGLLKQPRGENPVPKVIVATLTPAGNATGFLIGHAAAEDRRQEVNDALRAGGIGDAVVDFDAAVRDPADPSILAAEYDDGDGLHLSSAGYARLAEAIDLDSFVGRKCAK